jgi:hypothetical protein
MKKESYRIIDASHTTNCCKREESITLANDYIMRILKFDWSVIYEFLNMSREGFDAIDYSYFISNEGDFIFKNQIIIRIFCCDYGRYSTHIFTLNENIGEDLSHFLYCMEVCARS